jgi:hypothetical protein
VQLPRAGLPLQAAAPRVLPPVRRHWPQPVVSVVHPQPQRPRRAAGLFAQLGAPQHHGAAEVIVVDHASTDASLALLRQWRGRLDLKVLALDHNGSFSASSNLGASHARGQFLLFMNNDIVWLQDALPRLLESLHDPRVGVVGIKLLKVVGESRAGAQFASEVQHLGVRFKLNHLGYWPYEVEPSAQAHDEAEHAPQFVPAVTGAVLLCRKADFDAVGGFDPEYFTALRMWSCACAWPTVCARQWCAATTAWRCTTTATRACRAARCPSTTVCAQFGCARVAHRCVDQAGVLAQSGHGRRLHHA